MYFQINFSMNKTTKKTDTKSLDTNYLSHPTLFPLSPINKKPVEVSFTAEKISSDAGWLLLKEVEKNIGIIHSSIKQEAGSIHNVL
jgi:hypothetical protein